MPAAAARPARPVRALRSTTTTPGPASISRCDSTAARRTSEDAAVEWDETNDRINTLSQHTTGTLCPVNTDKVQIAGTDALTSDGAAKVQDAVAGDGLSASSGVLAVSVDDSTIEIDSDAVQLKDGGITTAKLGDTLADKLVQISIGDASGSSPQDVTIQAKDIQGNNLAEVVYVRIRVCDDEHGASLATNATIAVGGTGALVRSETASKDLVCRTDSTGALTITVTDGSSEDGVLAGGGDDAQPHTGLCGHRDGGDFVMARRADGRVVNVAGLAAEAQELAALRWQHGTGFRNSDGSRTYIVSRDLHCATSKGWTEHDLRLSDADPLGGYELAVATGHYRLDACRQVDVSDLLVVGSYWGTLGLTPMAIEVVSGDGVEIVGTPRAVQATLSGGGENGLTRRGELRWANAFGHGIELAVVPLEHRLSKRITLHASPSPGRRSAREGVLRVRWRFSTDLVVVVDGRIWGGEEIVTDQPVRFCNVQGDTRWSWPRPIVYDARRDEDACCVGTLRLWDDGESYCVAAEFPLAWFDEARYPVTIDPETYFGTTNDGRIWGRDAAYGTARGTAYNFLTDDPLSVGQTHHLRREVPGHARVHGVRHVGDPGRRDHHRRATVHDALPGRLGHRLRREDPRVRLGQPGRFGQHRGQLRRGRWRRRATPRSGATRPGCHLA